MQPVVSELLEEFGHDTTFDRIKDACKARGIKMSDATFYKYRKKLKKKKEIKPAKKGKRGLDSLPTEETDILVIEQIAKIASKAGMPRFERCVRIFTQVASLLKGACE